jgi:hypothetical protein
MKTSKGRLDVPIRADLHREASHLAVDQNTTIQLIVDELIELGLKYKKMLEKEKKDEA